MLEQLIVNVISLVIVLGSIGIAAWYIIMGEAFNEGLDGLFLVIICLLCAAVFSVVPLKTLREGSFRGLLKVGQDRDNKS